MPHDIGLGIPHDVDVMIPGTDAPICDGDPLIPGADAPVILDDAGPRCAWNIRALLGILITPLSSSETLNRFIPVWAKSTHVSGGGLLSMLCSRAFCQKSPGFLDGVS